MLNVYRYVNVYFTETPTTCSTPIPLKLQVLQHSAQIPLIPSPFTITTLSRKVNILPWPTWTSSCPVLQITEP